MVGPSPGRSQRSAIHVIPSATMAMITAASNRVVREIPSRGGMGFMAAHFAHIGATAVSCRHPNNNR